MLRGESTKVDGVIDFVTLILCLMEAAGADLLAWKDAVRSSKLGDGTKIKRWRHGWHSRFVIDWESILDTPFGVNIDSIVDTTYHILGKTPKEICAGISKSSRILHVESVLRQDLADWFMERQNKLRRRLLGRPFEELRACVPRQKGRRSFLANDKDELVKQLACPRLTFRGTRRKYVGSVVRYSFLKPGNRIGSTVESLEVRCGGACARGIYSSPSGSFSITYVGSSATAVQDSDVSSVQLTVCAAIMGRAATLTSDENWRSHGQPYSNSGSHIANEFEYTVFDASQILPCYVIHLDWGSKEARRVLEKVPNNPSVWVKAQARKRNKTHPNLGRDISYPND